MAGDWIKWTKGLPDKPEVIRLAGLLRLSREVVVCRLMRFWEWCDDNIPKDAIREVGGSAFVTLSPHDGDNAAFIDALVGTPLFADSLAAVGWLRLRDGRLELPNFGRHNGETAKTRARNANNQKRMRLAQEPSQGPSITTKTTKRVTKMSPKMSPHDGDKTVTREEERRVSKGDESPLTPSCPEPASPTSGQSVADLPAIRPSETALASPETAAMSFPVVGTGPREWSLSGAKFAEYQASFPGLDIPDQLRRARQWLLDNPSRRKTAAGMPRFLGSWLGRANDHRRPPGPAATYSGFARGAGRTKAEQLDEYFADQVESVLESQIEEGGR